MPGWEYKTLVYTYEGNFFLSFCALWGWADSLGKSYGPRLRFPVSPLRFPVAGGRTLQMCQLEEALKELNREGWELVSATWNAQGVQGSAVLRKPSTLA
jgi:hypothetical protein